ncbi:GntR family transcriptional regulator [Planotetraspora kaengkrachanensis]|uniref:GntR family transcriptional regulator n=1 Tax=Planotetraspora kaengkrachanensis TaxID=575193 RepID=A0A8J3V9X2_9ACTN|nr:GntR family transcriptional regulator [Planotetraspora kaengkrachanensis]GIG82946.1 GntR family transcriptional regulator [Planotetraspora kaengkrachanensis]
MNPRPTLVVTADDPTPPYEQLRRQLVDLIRSRVIGPGDRLPPLRQLAGDLGLAVGTVARTYRELESAGLVHSKRGGGTRVVDDPPHLSTSERQRLLHQQAAIYVRHALLLGVDRQAAIEAIQQALAE